MYVSCTLRTYVYNQIYISAQSVITPKEVHVDDSNLEREENVQNKVYVWLIIATVNI